jgi:oxygen-independent coproporphyrinogen-3 oxidase
VLPLSVFKGLLDALSEAGHGGPYEEFTVEVNPEDIVEKGEAYVEGLLKLGVNRISMGVQSFDDGILKFMNRRHDADTALRAYAVLEKAGVRNISIDLIFGLPQLSDEQWADTLKKALEISPSGVLPQHISSYQLSVEPGSMLARMVEKGMWSEASDELCERQYRILCETLAQAGYHHYEISNFAHPGYEAVHNSAYWRHVPYVGLGPGAHSFVCGNLRMWNKPDLKGYIADPCGIQEHEDLDAEQLVLEKIMLALRTSDGIQDAYLHEHCDNAALKRAFAAGDLEHAASGNVRIPENRFFISDSIISEIV